MGNRLTDALTAPLAAPDTATWQAALQEATSMLAGLAVRRGGAGPFRITDHDVRSALCDGDEPGQDDPFTWSARTARRALGLAAVRRLTGGAARAPADAVRAHLAEAADLVRQGNPCVTQLDRWVAGLPPAGLAAAGAEAVTWATRLWCGLDWTALGEVPSIGRDRWWDSPHSALLALRGRADVRTAQSALVVLSGPRRDSVRAELALVALVDALRCRGGTGPGRVVGWWPDSGHIVRVEPEPTVLTQGAQAVALVLARPATLRRAA